VSYYWCYCIYICILTFTFTLKSHLGVHVVKAYSQESEWSCICVSGVSMFPFSTIWIFDFGIVAIVWYFLFIFYFVAIWCIFNWRYFYIMILILFCTVLSILFSILCYKFVSVFVILSDRLVLRSCRIKQISVILLVLLYIHLYTHFTFTLKSHLGCML
jgi:hypothetical protein